MLEKFVSSRSVIATGAGLGLVAVSPLALAQSDPAADNSGLAEIVVTAQRKETRLQDTPIAIAVLGEGQLKSRHVVSLLDIQSSVPGLRINTGGQTRNSSLQIAIRGLAGGADAYQVAQDQAVGVYVDGVFLGRAAGLGTALMDVERIEVLKGPQGTLFGRNTEGGAISIVTKRPSGEFRAEVTAGLSNFGGHEASAHIDLPSFKNVSIKIDGVINRRDGTLDNPLPGYPDFNEFDKRGLRVSALWEPSDTLSALYAYDTAYDASTPYYYQLLQKGSLPVAPIIVALPDRVRTATIGVPQRLSVGKTSGHALTLEWKATNDLTVKSITAYRELKQSQFDNNAPVSTYAPGAPFSRDSRATLDQDQFSQEFQVLGGYDALNFVAGAYYFREHAEDSAASPNTLRWNADGTGYSLLDTPVGAVVPLDRASKATVESSALFGQATWTPEFLGDSVHITAGGRYTHDKKTGSLFIVNGATPTVDGVTAPLLLDRSWNRFDPLVNVSVDLDPDVMVYGKWSTGYRSGGANSRSLIFRAFDPESVSSFEIGAKTEFFDRRLRVNVAAFTTLLKNQQVGFSFRAPNVNRTTAETANADGNSRIKGIEADVTVSLARGLTLSGSYAYLKASRVTARNPFADGNPLVTVLPDFAPKHSASGALDYAVPLEGVTFLAHFDASYASRQFISDSDPSSFSEKVFLVNGRVALGDIQVSDSGARLEVAAWSRNLFNRDHVFARFSQAALGTFGAYNEARTYGVTATIRY